MDLTEFAGQSSARARLTARQIYDDDRGGTVRLWCNGEVRNVFVMPSASGPGTRPILYCQVWAKEINGWFQTSFYESEITAFVPLS